MGRRISRSKNLNKAENKNRGEVGMEKSGKIFNFVDKILYIVLGIVWLLFCTVIFISAHELSGIAEIIFSMLMMIIIVTGIIHLSKKTYKLSDAAIFLLVPILYIILAPFAIDTEFYKGGLIIPATVTIICGIPNCFVTYKNQSVQQNVKVSKTLDNAIKFMYIIAAAVWVLGSCFIFINMKNMRYSLEGGQIVAYFIPFLIMLAIIGIGFYGTMKEKGSMLNALLIMILPWTVAIIGFVNHKKFLEGNKFIFNIFGGYIFQSLPVGLLGAVIVIFMMIARKYRK